MPTPNLDRRLLFPLAVTGHFAAFTQPERFLAVLRTRVRPLGICDQPLIHPEGGTMTTQIPWLGGEGFLFATQPSPRSSIP